ncbi:Glutathione S-transferase Mu 4 [Chytriomyces hyalinus]|nr:Glutathione S-transferase Mu 4 [Chytriomyces hyalinus]
MREDNRGSDFLIFVGLFFRSSHNLNSDKMVAVLAYWAIRGLAAPIRYLLEYTNTPYEDKHYSQGDGPEFSRAEWMDEKPGLSADLPFANLPYFIDGSVKLTQSNAIIRYIAE